MRSVFWILICRQPIQHGSTAGFGPRGPTLLSKIVMVVFGNKAQGLIFIHERIGNIREQHRISIGEVSFDEQGL
jgi:hypothetical protein